MYVIDAGIRNINFLKTWNWDDERKVEYNKLNSNFRSLFDLLNINVYRAYIIFPAVTQDFILFW